MRVSISMRRASPPADRAASSSSISGSVRVMVCAVLTRQHSRERVNKGLKGVEPWRPGENRLRPSESAVPSRNAPIRFCTSMGTRYSRMIARWSRSPTASRWTTKHHRALLASRNRRSRAAPAGACSGRSPESARSPSWSDSAASAASSARPSRPSAAACSCAIS